MLRKHLPAGGAIGQDVEVGLPDSVPGYAIGEVEVRIDDHPPHPTAARPVFRVLHFLDPVTHGVDQVSYALLEVFFPPCGAGIVQREGVSILPGDLGKPDLDQHLIKRSEWKPGCMLLENMQTGGTAENQLGCTGSSKIGFQVLEDPPELGLLPQTKGGIAAAPEEDAGPGHSIAQG